MCCLGSMYPQLRSAAFTRSLLSRTAVSGSPTVISASFSPALRSTSTETGYALIPKTEADWTRNSILHLLYPIQWEKLVLSEDFSWSCSLHLVRSRPGYGRSPGNRTVDHGGCWWEQ